jgi:diphosphomevalonate decarboxylase
MKASEQSLADTPSVIAHPNIALIKYWGKRPGAGNLPAVGSLSITLDTLRSVTCVRIDEALGADVLLYGGAQAGSHDTARVQQFLGRVRALAGMAAGPYCRVQTDNNFPTGAGLASSASGFAALALAASRAYGLTLSPADLSALARSGSGSAARSIFGGFVYMARGRAEDGRDAIASPLLPASAWPLRVVVAITDKKAKAIGSTEGMERTRATSPYWQGWVEAQEADLAEAAQAVRARDFAALADVAEHSCAKMHALALSARPPLLYWLPSTVGALQAVGTLRRDGVPVFATMDAGPQVKAVCLPEAEQAVAQSLRSVPGVLEVLTVGLGEGARQILTPAG